MDKILLNWGLTGATTTRMEGGQKPSWDINGLYVFKNNEIPGVATRSIFLTQLLARENIPTATYIPTNTGAFVTPDDLYTMATKIKGVHINLFENPHLATEFGQSLAHLHKALSHIESEIACEDNSFLIKWRDYILPKLKLSGVAVPNEIISHVEAQLTKVYPKLPRQPIHGDAHARNILFDEDGKIAAWFDFDNICRNTRLFDLAELLVDIIIARTPNRSNFQTWRQICDTFLLAYDKINPLTAEERSNIDDIIIVNKLYFAAFYRESDRSEEQNKAIEHAKWLYFDKTKS